MGYRRPREASTTYRLLFAEPDMQGLEVDVRPAPLGVVKDFAKLADFDGSPKQELEATLWVLEQFAEALVGWNLEDETGEPVPATFDSLLSYDRDFTFRIVESWLLHAMSAGGAADAAGDDPIAGSLPVEPLTGPE